MNKPFKKRINLRPRLETVAALMPACDTVADIGCDHGRLGIGLLQRGIATRAILGEISATSLEKARRLGGITGLNERIDFRVGDGLSVLKPDEAEAIAICGMGGMLIRDMLNTASIPLMGARTAVLLPMRGIDELRQYLFYNGYTITGDRIARENGRLYQIIRIAQGHDEMPAKWPKDCFSLGFHAIGDRLFPELANALLTQTEQSLESARGSRAEETLAKKAEELRQLLSLCACPANYSLP